MKRIAPSEQIHQALEAFLSDGIEDSEQPVTALLKLAAQRVIQEAMEQEVTDYLGRERYARTAIFEYIEVWYKRQRLHSSLGYLSPEEFEQHLVLHMQSVH